MYDAIVIGARCAGASTALLLARAGHRVLLADRATFPSDTMSTHMIQPAGLAALERWGLLDRLWETGCPRLEDLRMDFGPIALDGPPPIDFGHVVIEGKPTPIDGIDYYAAPRRTVLDNMLVQAAVEAGAELREGAPMRELVFEGDRVVGVRLGGENGNETVEKAKVVVGADGMNSSVAKAVGAETYNDAPSLTVGYYAYWSGIEDTRATLSPHPGRNIAELPTNDGQTLVNVSWPVDEFHTVREDIEGHVHSSIEEHAPGLAERMRGAERTERFKGTAVVPNFFRKPHGPGWALVGDAGYHKDPIGAHGIMDALRHAELLAEAIGKGVAGDQPMDEALAGYQATRDERSAPLYFLNVQLAELNPGPEVLAVTGAIAKVNDPEDVGNLLGVICGSVPPADFFTPENLVRVLEAADVPMEVLGAAAPPV
jgi:2-polyprenyl-6-methoxyphenol hydroxylase-like FAD-dependent oxidoreductase